MTHKVRSIGFRAHAALRRSGGVAVPVPGFSKISYFQAGGEVIWVGTADIVMHPRAVLVSRPFTSSPTQLCFDLEESQPWYPPPVSDPGARACSVAAACDALRCEIVEIRNPKGIGKLMTGGEPDFPLDLGVGHIERLARAYRHGDPDEVHDASQPLLGFGPGLTPSGDDFVGGALFARRIVFHEAFADAGRKWAHVAERLARSAREGGHVISAALFADLAQGWSFAPLHRLGMAVLAYGRRPAGCRGEMAMAARELVSVGRSSGWDMLAGFMTGITGNVFVCDRFEEN